MPNPALPSSEEKIDNQGLYQEVEGVVINDKVVLSSQQATIADAVVAHSITDTAAQLDAANETELEGFYDALGVKINAIIAVLDAHGLTADS